MQRAEVMLLRRRRLESQRLAGQPATRGDALDPVAAASGMLAVQAQDFAAAKWALGVRSPRSTVADIDAAFDSGALVRSWPFRGTLHVVAAEELGWMLALTSARTVRSAATRQRQLGLDEAVFARASDVTRSILRGGVRLTRDELYAELELAGIDTARQRGSNLLWYLSHIGLVCLGPTAGTGQSVVLTSEWIRQPRELSRAEALTELAVRYFETHGPATARDLLWWSNILVPEATSAIEGARDRLAETVIDGSRYFSSATRPLDPDVESGAARRPSTLLLPGFDEYLLGYRDRTAQLAEEHSPAVVPGSNGIFLPMLVSQGKIVGTWQRQTRRSIVDVHVTPFAPLSGSNTFA